MQTDSCLDSEQNGTHFISVGGQEGGFGGWVVILGQRPKIWTCLSTTFFFTPPVPSAISFPVGDELLCVIDEFLGLFSLPCCAPRACTATGSNTGYLLQELLRV